MSKSLLNAIRRIAFSHIYIQAVASTLLSIIFWVCGKKYLGYSLFIGGMICTLPNLFFAYRLFLRTGAKNVQNILKGFYIGEIGKFFLTILLFYIAFKYMDLDKLFLLVGFVVAQITFGLAALFLRSQHG